MHLFCRQTSNSLFCLPLVPFPTSPHRHISQHTSNASTDPKEREHRPRPAAPDCTSFLDSLKAFPVTSTVSIPMTRLLPHCLLATLYIYLSSAGHSEEVARTVPQCWHECLQDTLSRCHHLSTSPTLLNCKTSVYLVEIILLVDFNLQAYALMVVARHMLPSSLVPDKTAPTLLPSYHLLKRYRRFVQGAVPQSMEARQRTLKIYWAFLLPTPAPFTWNFETPKRIARALFQPAHLVLQGNLILATAHR